jgi:hypothetical protein
MLNDNTLSGITKKFRPMKSAMLGTEKVLWFTTISVADNASLGFNSSRWQ